MIRLPLVDRVKFLIERQFVKGAGFQLLIVAAVIGLISMLGGIAVWLLGDGRPLSELVWWAFLRLTDPGYLGDDQGTWRRVVSTLLTVAGYVVFLGALVAIMTQWLIARMREFERGLTPVALRNHIVIIGWTNRTVPLLRELLGNDRSRNRFRDVFGTRRMRPVVLSMDVSAVQAQTLRADAVIGREAGRVILRYGSPLEEEAIQRAACLNAAAVIMPSDFGRAGSLISPDVETIRALLSMDARAAQHHQEPPLVIAEIQDARRMEMVRRAYRGPLEIVPSDDMISRLLTQNLLHPGLSAFYREVLDTRAGNEIYLRPAGRMAGASLKEIAGLCPRAVLIGVLRDDNGQWRPELNPESARLLQPGEQLIMLAREFEDTQPSAGRGSRLAAVERARPPTAQRPAVVDHRILLLGWNQRIPNFILELASYSHVRFAIDLVSSTDPSMRQREIEQYSSRCARVATRHVEADFLLSGELEKFDLASYSTIFLVSSDRLASVEEADARAIVGYRVIESLLEGSARKPRVLLELADAANEGLIRGHGAETFISPLIISHILAQVTLQRGTRLIFDELFTQGGAELEFRALKYYGKRGPLSFAALEMSVAERGETLLGVQIHRPDRAPELQLNPPRETVFDLAEPDRLCVLTSGWPATTVSRTGPAGPLPDPSGKNT